MPRVRWRFDGKFKSKVALEAIRGLKSISEIAREFKVPSNQVTMWKKQLLDGAVSVFEGSGTGTKKSGDEPALRQDLLPPPIQTLSVTQAQPTGDRLCRMTVQKHLNRLLLEFTRITTTTLRL